MKSNELNGTPECLWVVSWGEKSRVYAKRGQANNWAAKKINEGKLVRIKKYVPSSDPE